MVSPDKELFLSFFFFFFFFLSFPSRRVFSDSMADGISIEQWYFDTWSVRSREKIKTFIYERGGRLSCIVRPLTI